MGLPQVNVNFVALAKTASKRAERGIVGMILKDTAQKDNPFWILPGDEVPKGLTEENKEQVRLAMIGNVSAPRKVLVYCLPEDAEDYTEALEAFETKKIQYLCAPTCETDEQTETIAEWVKTQRKNKHMVKAVLPNTEADEEGVINYTTEMVTDGKTSYSAEAFCSRIAGLLAGTPITQAVTFAVLPELTDCSRLSRAELNGEDEQGHLVAFHDGEKVKMGRGVNSLLTIPNGKNERFRKIKIVEAMDMINDDIVKLVEEYYIGKYANSYDNKCVLLCAISDYFRELQMQGVLANFSVGIDVQANKKYLEEKGILTADMAEEEIMKADTEEKVFLSAELLILDAIEDVTLAVTV